MKKFTCLVVALFAWVSMSHAGGFSVGGHGAYTVGGDVESEEFGYGAQVGLDISESLSVELSGTMFSDEVDADDLGTLDIDVQHIALSACIDLPLSDVLGFYVGGGVSYNMFEVDEPDLANVIAELADNQGMAQAYADLVAAGGTITGGLDIEIDDAIGYHACAGVSLALSDSVELFGEYRFTWLDIEGEASADVTVSLGGVVVQQISESQDLDEGSYDFGLARVGINILL